MARSRAHDYADKQSLILDTAARLFGLQGFERVSMSLVATECGVSKALLYHYYSSKEALLDDMVMRHLERLIVVVSEASASEKIPRQRLLAMVSAVLQCYHKNADKHRVQQRCQASMSMAKQEATKALERALVQNFSDVIYQAVPELQNKPDLQRPVTMTLFGILNWTYTWFNDSGQIDRDEYANLVTTMMIDGARHIK